MTEGVAQQIWERQFGRLPSSIKRLAGGSGSYVYFVEDLGSKFTLRMAKPADRRTLEGTLYWTAQLSVLGIPIPEVLHSDTSSDPPWAVTNFIEGEDLGRVFRTLSEHQKREIAKRVVQCQIDLRSNLPRAHGYGYLNSYQDAAAKASWTAVVVAHLDRSLAWMNETGLFGASYIDRARRLLGQYEGSLSLVEPVPFFDDATTKNVLIDQGKFSGIIDLDWICFGDWLYFVALTRMSLLASNDSTSYSEYLLEAMGLKSLDRKLLDFYTLVFCADFMGGLGMTFNKTERPTVHRQDVERLIEIYEILMNNLE